MRNTALYCFQTAKTGIAATKTGTAATNVLGRDIQKTEVALKCYSVLLVFVCSLLRRQLQPQTGLRLGRIRSPRERTKKRFAPLSVLSSDEKHVSQASVAAAAVARADERSEASEQGWL